MGAQCRRSARAGRLGWGTSSRVVCRWGVGDGAPAVLTAARSLSGVSMVRCGALREVLPQQAVGVLVGATLPRAVWVTESTLPVRCQSAAGRVVTSRIPDPRVSERRNCSGSGRDRRGDRVPGGLGAVAGERRPVLDSRPTVVHRRQMQQHGEPGAALDQGKPIAELPSPRIRSPSQCPGTARSSVSAGRSLIRISSVTNPLPRARLRALGTRSARPVRRHAVSSRRSAPRPCTYSAW